ncbi:acyl-protein synthetase [Annulohypoxylon truncatum]|uniref:acyl-protein synthetase n=1 Tax=Annulohypoxylon truncatum TaxID=327061 RepID=UPI002008D14B|nr:acyl-protein synthetase [Annulohypoxylon truncatum]KAI1207203.1 acyl-protein synthetase [Annulohypoxylon truncatum]
MKLYPLGNHTDPMVISYKDLYTQAQSNSIKIRRISGFEEHRPILLYFDTHENNIIWFWSVLLANGIPVISAPFGNADNRHDHIVKLSMLLEHPICITTDDLLSLFGTGHGMDLQTVDSLLKLDISSENPMCVPRYNSGSATATLMLTSGSTGMPKAVRLSHKQILAAVAGKASVRQLPRKRPFFNWIGLDHVASLVEIHIQSLWLGVDQIHAHAADVVSSPKTFLSLLHRHRVSQTFAPNFFLAKLVTTMQPEESDEDWDFSNLAWLASGGEDNDVDTCVAASALLQRYGAPRNVITAGFGMTETCAGAIFNLNCPDYDVKLGRSVASLGMCMNGIEMRVTVPGRGLQLASPNEAGNLEVRGNVVFDGYYRNPKATAEAFTSDGWFRTGDQAMIDNQGYLSLIGRVKDIININGAKFAMSNVQTALAQALNHRITRFVTFPSRAAHTEQVTVAYIPRDWQMSDEEIMKIEEVASEVCQLQVGASPLVFALREESAELLPTSTLGKISRAKMRILYESGVFSKDVELHLKRVKELKQGRHKAVNRDMNDTEALFVSALVEIYAGDPADIGVNTSIFELGFSSIDVIRLKNRIDGELGIKVPVTTLMRHPTPAAIANALGSDCHSRTMGDALSATYDPVVVFHAGGSKTPLWLVHPGIGEVLVFVGLAQHIASDDRPVYALRARGFEPGHARFKSIEEAVDTYIAAIRQRQPQGPYALAGYSYGTMLAFEITKKLEAADGAGIVQFFGSFNLPPHIKTRMRQLHWNACLLHLIYFLGLTTEAEAERIGESDFEKMSRDQALTYILELSDPDRMAELGLHRYSLTRWTNVAYDLPHMATNYEPEGKVEAMDVFYATPLKAAAPNREVWLKDHLIKWRDFCNTKPRFHEVDGAHYTMIGPDHVATFWAILRSALDARGV